MSDKQAFDDAFATARAQGLETFKWDGDTFTTQIREEVANDANMSSALNDTNLSSTLNDTNSSVLNNINSSSTINDTDSSFAANNVPTSSSTVAGLSENSTLTFNEAFADARAEGCNTFKWNGNEYNTKIKAEEGNQNPVSTSSETISSSISTDNDTTNNNIKKCSNASNINLDNIKTVGASESTSKTDNLTEQGVEASKKLVSMDYDKLKHIKTDINSVAEESGVPKEILGAIISRESRGGKLLNPDGSSKFGGNGMGLMQIDTKTSGLSDIKTANTHDHILQGANHFKSLQQQVKNQHPDWNDNEILQGTIAAYNFGSKNVQTKEGIDKGTTHNDYSNDVIARAQQIKKDNIFE